MRKPSKRHTSNDFGKSPTSGGAMSGMDGPMIGASSSIMVDALAESESGATPSPPPVSVKALAIAFIAMFLIGATGLAVIVAHDRAVAPMPYSFSYGANGTGTLAGNLDGIGSHSVFVATTSTVPANSGRSTPVPELAYDSSTAFLINGRPLSVSASTEGTLTIWDVTGWPVRVEYMRVRGSTVPLATRVEFSAPESQVEGAIGGH